MIADRGAALADRRWGKIFTGIEIIFDLIEDPRITDGGPADHDPVDTIPVAVRAGFLGGFDIAVAKDGDSDARVFLYPGNEGPVGLPLVELGAGTAMDGQSRNTGVL